MKKQRVNSTDFDDPRYGTVPPRLSPRLEKRVASYAMAAGAAGVGLLALAPSAKADIIYFPGPSGLSDLADGGVRFWVNTDFPTMSGEFGRRSALYVYACLSGGCSAGGIHGELLPRGAVIGPSLSFGNVGQINGPVAAASTGGRIRYGTLNGNFYPPYGLFSNVGGGWANKSGYLAMEFVTRVVDTDERLLNFGWARLSVTAGQGSVGLQIDGAAYNTVPGQSIFAGQTAVPEPATLGLLALGSLGIAAWRRRKTVTSDK